MLTMMMVLVAAMQQAAKPDIFDTPMAELHGGRPEGVLDRLSLNQMMRFSALPEARLREFQCAGVANWAGSKAWPMFAMADGERRQFVARVTDAIANDVEMERDLAAGLIEVFSQEPPHREKKGELEQWRAGVERDCAALMATVRSGDYRLAPLARPTVVNTTLATCYVRYTLGAEARKGEEAAAMLKTAGRAEMLALSGKEGEALTAAKTALADQLAAARGERTNAEGDDMMRLVMCLPAMDAAEKEMVAK